MATTYHPMEQQTSLMGPFMIKNKNRNRMKLTKRERERERERDEEGDKEREWIQVSTRPCILFCLSQHRFYSINTKSS